MKPIKLTKAKALPIMQKAFRAGKLQAQVEEARDGVCYYRHPEHSCSCIIGCLLTTKQAELCDGATDTTALRSLINRGFITTDDDDYFRRAQLFRDDWLLGGVDRHGEYLRAHIGLAGDTPLYPNAEGGQQ